MKKLPRVKIMETKEVSKLWDEAWAEYLKIVREKGYYLADMARCPHKTS